MGSSCNENGENKNHHKNNRMDSRLRWTDQVEEDLKRMKITGWRERERRIERSGVELLNRPRPTQGCCSSSSSSSSSSSREKEEKKKIKVRQNIPRLFVNSTLANFTFMRRFLTVNCREADKRVKRKARQGSTAPNIPNLGTRRRLVLPSHYGRFTPWEESQHSLRRLCGPQSLSGHFEGTQVFLAFAGI
jgi:hypothetical protein